MLMGRGRLDKNALVGTFYGNNNQIEIIEFITVTNLGSIYRVVCHECEKDKELHGDAIYDIALCRLKKNSLPCGCALSPHWSKKQRTTLAERVAKNLGYIFHGWKSYGKNPKNRVVVIECLKHNLQETPTWSDFMRRRAAGGCYECRRENLGKRASKPDEVMIESFENRGSYPEGTVFERSERKNTDGSGGFWFIYCSGCGEKTEACSVVINSGVSSCSCNRQQPNKAYILAISDNNGNYISLKYGITKNIKFRKKDIQKRTPLEVDLIGCWSFDGIHSCRAAENFCKQEFGQGIMSRADLPDGHTETTYCYNLDRIIQIYENFGGIRIYE